MRPPPINGLRTSAGIKRADDNFKLQIQGRHLFAVNVVMAIPRRRSIPYNPFTVRKIKAAK